MTPTYRQVKDRIEELEREAEALRRHEARAIIADIRRKIREYCLTPEQLFGPDLSDLVRYRDPQTGKTWNGFGRPPKWIQGKDRALYRVD